MNPIFLQKEQTQKELEFNSQFNITFVKEYRFYDNNSFMFIKKFCEEKNISFLVRNYDSSIFQEDCDYISQLPAIHIYSQKKGYLNTFYLSNDIMLLVENEINKVKIEEEKKRLKKEYYLSFISWFWK